MEDNTPSFFRFEDLRIYTKSVEFGKFVVNNLREPRNIAEKEFVRVFVRSAMDISLSIAEGSSRNKSQFESYLKDAKTALRECVTYTSVANGLGLLGDDECSQSRELLMELTRMIGAMIISLGRGGKRGYEDGVSDHIDEVQE